MTQTPKPSLRSVLATITVVVVAAAATLGSLAIASESPPGDATTRAAACPGADAPAAETTGRKLRKSVRCLLNTERAVHGFGKLKRRGALEEAAQRHTKTMVETDCLAHRCGGEVDLETRLRQAGYFAGADSWSFAENTGCALSAEAMVAGWMDVRFHRINILDNGFSDLGVGVVHKRIEDRCDPGFVTFAVVFGDRAQ